jgi:hypothetical protein
VDARFPDDVGRLFWDVDLNDVDLELHHGYVMERAMSRGDWTAMRWLRATYPKASLGDFVTRKGDRLAPRDLAYWALVTDTPVTVPPGGGRPKWAGP